MQATEAQQASILVVDDNKENLRVVSGFLKGEGYRIALSLNAADALTILKENEIDLVLLDIMMPVTDGYSFCRQLKTMEAFREIPVVFLTAKTEPKDLVEGFRAGGVDYITKPFHKEELIARVKNHLELAAAKKQIARQAKQIQKANETKDRLYSVIAHDIKSPFSNISMMISSIAEGYLEPDSEEFRDIIQNINSSTKETYTLLENLLQWTRSQTGNLELMPENISVSELVNNACRYLTPNARQKDISLKQSAPQGLSIYADRLTMQSVLQNLVSNAIKFTRPGGQVEVTAGESPPEVFIRVTDNGVGMSRERLNKLFLVGHHQTSRGTRNEKGSGLGLILAKDFTTRNQGRIEASSQCGKGSRFTIFLPREKTT